MGTSANFIFRQGRHSKHKFIIAETAVHIIAGWGDVWLFVGYTVTCLKGTSCEIVYVQQEDNMAEMAASDRFVITLRSNCEHHISSWTSGAVSCSSSISPFDKSG